MTTDPPYYDESYCEPGDHRFIEERTEVTESYVYVYDYCDFCGISRVRNYEYENTEMNE